MVQTLPPQSEIYSALVRVPLSTCCAGLCIVFLRPSYLKCNNVKSSANTIFLEKRFCDHSAEKPLVIVYT